MTYHTHNVEQSYSVIFMSVTGASLHLYCKTKIITIPSFQATDLAYHFTSGRPVSAQLIY